MIIPTIKAKGFILRPFRKGDAASLAKNINAKKIYRYTLHIPYPYTLRHAKDWIRKSLSEYKKKNPSMINFVIDIDGKLAGSISLGHIISRHQAEAGYWLARKHRGMGIMTRALKEVTKFGFNNLKLRRLYLQTFPFNKASMRVAEKAGYKFEGVLRKSVKKGNKYIDANLFAKVR